MLNLRTSIFLLLLLGVTLDLAGQQANLMVRADRKAPSEFFIELSLQSGINIIYSDNLIEQLPPITLEMKGVTIDEILKEVLRGTFVTYQYVGDQIVLVQQAVPEQKFTISGLVTDSLSGEPLISAFVYDDVSRKSTMTNEYGYYSITLPKGDVRLIAGYSNYNLRRLSFYIDKDIQLQLKLRSTGYLPEIIVFGESVYEDELIPIAERITFKELNNNIQLGGASDLYRATDFIPGIHTGTDGVGGYHVRGGANDQNLILMDGVPVYHPNHLLGIISVFNHQVLQQAALYKANFPSKFSGRLSSVMDVRVREGNLHDWSLSGNVGASEFGLMTEGPIIQDKAAILVSGRFFLPGLVMKDITQKYKRKNGIGGVADLDYFDVNGKINWKISNFDRVYFSFYSGSDMFLDLTETEDDMVDPGTGIRIVSKENYGKSLNWSNQMGVFRWNHIVSENIFANLIVSSSSFTLQSIDSSRFLFTFPGTSLSSLSGFDTKEFKSSIRDITAKLELDIRPTPDHQLSAGIYGIDYLFKPKSITINEESKVGDFYLDEGLVKDIYTAAFQVNAVEAGIYFEDKWKISKNVEVTSGIHVASFFVQKDYYIDPQLRVRFDYRPKENIAFNVGYSRMIQYLHNITSSSIGLPTDLWVPTTSKVSPALSDQYELAALWKPARHSTLHLSAYIKDMRNLVSYQEGASFLITEGIFEGSIPDAANWEAKVTTGTGESSGVELQYEFEHEKLSLKVNGTWSRAFRHFDEINNGKPFPDRYDRRWSGTFSSQYRIGPRWTAGVNFIFGTGIAITLAESKFFNPGSFFPQIGINYTERNGFRLPAYHRMDVNVLYDIGSTKRFNHSLVVNLYNVYNRTNPFYITLVEDPATGKFEGKQFSLFKFFPSISYRFTLK